MKRTVAWCWATAIGAATLGAVLVYRLHTDRWHRFFDLRIYHAAVRYWLDGGNIYDYAQPDTVNATLGFTYPPFAAVCMAPMAWLSWQGAAAVATTATAAALTLTTYWLVAPVARRHGWPRWFAVALAVPLVAALEPVRETFAFGQVNLYLVVLVLADLLIALPRGSRLTGVGIGLATAVKLTPGIFIVYLLVTRRWRAAATAAGTAVAATLFAAAVDPAMSWRFWTDTFWDTGRVGYLDNTSNQSLYGLLARLADPHPPSRLVWLVLVVVAACYGMWRAAAAARAGDELAGITLAGLAGVLVSPTSWTHHLYWVVPALVILVDVAAGSALSRRWTLLGFAGLTYAVFVSGFVWRFGRRSGHHDDGGLIGILGENAYLLLVVALVVTLPVRRGSGADRPDPDVVHTPRGAEQVGQRRQ